MSYRVEVQTKGDPKYYGNMLVFATIGEAEAYARNLASRWILVEQWRVVRCDDAVNAKWPRAERTKGRDSDDGSSHAN
jgi:hypothetical protein